MKNWLMDAGIGPSRIRLAQGMNWLHVNASVWEAERLMRTEYHIFEHTMTRTLQVACHEYHLPAHISKLVDFVTPTVHFDAKVKAREPHKRVNKGPIKSKRQENIDSLDVNEVESIRPGFAATVGTALGSLPKQGATLAEDEVSAQLENCDRQITPDCLRSLYQFSPGTSAQASNSYGIVEYTPQSFLPGDLDKFFTNFSTKQIGQRPKLNSVDGGVLINYNQSFETNGESDLDLQVAMTLIYPQTVTLFQVGDLIEGASFNNFLDSIDGSYCTFEGGDDPTQDAIYPDPPDGYIGPDNCGGYSATKVISTSYSYNEADVTPAYANRQCQEYMKLGLQGVTVLYSSGDYGVAGNLGRCIDPATGNYTATNASTGIFNPSFPGTCPYITSVGATQVPNNTNIVRVLASGNANASTTQPEQACETVIHSGGGFSNFFSMPQYQASAVHTYWTQHTPPYGSSRFNNSQRTRGFPDVSANGANYVIAVDGNYSLVYGTSASAPMFGSLITLINEERIKAGKSSVGFLNNVLYQHPEYVLPSLLVSPRIWLTCCRMMKDVTTGSNQGCGTKGFSAVEGWDPLTGLGTPIFPKMMEVFMGLP